MELDLIVGERKESLDHELEVTLEGLDNQRFINRIYLRRRSHPEVESLQIGDRIKVVLTREPAVQDVERIVEEAQRPVAV